MTASGDGVAQEFQPDHPVKNGNNPLYRSNRTTWAEASRPYPRPPGVFWARDRFGGLCQHDDHPVYERDVPGRFVKDAQGTRTRSWRRIYACFRCWPPHVK